MKITLNLQIASQESGIPKKSQFKIWVKTVCETQQRSGEITIRVVDESEMITLNQTYRHKNNATNVLSFPYQSPAPVAVSLLGDIVICAPTIKREAKEQHKAVLAHWAHITIHGTLHLLGYDHIKEKDAETMEQLEITLLEKLGFPNPY